MLFSSSPSGPGRGRKLLLPLLLLQAAAALSVQSEGTQTDNPVFNIDDTINRLSLELSTHQQRLDSIEQGRLEMVTINRLLSFLPKSAYSKEEDGFSDQDIATSYDGSWGGNRNQYPAV